MARAHSWDERSGQGPVGQCRKGTDGHRTAGPDKVEQPDAGDRLQQRDSPGGTDQCLSRFAQDLTTAGGKAVPDVGHGTPRGVHRGMVGIRRVRIEPGERTEGPGGISLRIVGVAVVDPAPLPAALAPRPEVRLSELKGRTGAASGLTAPSRSAPEPLGPPRPPGSGRACLWVCCRRNPLLVWSPIG